MRTLVIALLAACGEAKIAELNPENFNELVFDDHTSAMIKFYAPWCEWSPVRKHGALHHRDSRWHRCLRTAPPAHAPAHLVFHRAPTGAHCKSMAPAWRELAVAYEHDKNILIGEVDCTSESESLCERFQVDSYPSLRYSQAGDSDLHDVDVEEHDAKSLLDFAQANMKPSCVLAHKEACSDSERKQLDAYLAMTQDERVAELETVSEPLHEKRDELEMMRKEIEELEEKADELEENYNELRNEVHPKMRMLLSMIEEDDEDEEGDSSDEEEA